MVEWSLDALAAAESIAAIVVAVPAGHEERLARDGVEVVAGGPSRSESVARALGRVGDEEIVVVHDAARPLASAKLFDAVVARLMAEDAADAVIAAAPVTDTTKEVLRGDEVSSTLDRSSLWSAQTPQVFRMDALRRAHASTELLAQASDDAMLVERNGGTVLVHEAPATNIKVTTPLDLRLAELLLTG